MNIKHICSDFIAFLGKMIDIINQPTAEIKPPGFKEIPPPIFALSAIIAGIILGMGSANQRRRYNVTSSLLG